MSDFSESDLSTDGSEYSDASEQPWQEEIDEGGELFYVEEEQSTDTVTIHGEVEEPRREQFSSAGKNDHRVDSRPLQDRPGGDARSTSTTTTTGTANISERESKQTVPRIKTVFVAVRPPFSYDTESSSLLKEMLGIISRRADGSYRFNELITENSVIISAMVPDGPVFATESVEIGDVLLAINNVAVYRSNIEEVLGRIPHKMELRLTLHCRDPSMYGTHPVVASSDRNQQNVQVSLDMLKISNSESSGDKLDPFQAVFYLTLNVDSETAKGEEDIIYMYPKDSLGIRKLKSTRGVFTTLADVATDAFKSEVQSSIVFVNDELVQCAYCRNNSEVLVMCVPGSSNFVSSLHGTLHKTIRLLRFMYGSLTKAFEFGNFLRLNHLFHLIFSSMSVSHHNASDTSFSGMNSPLYGIKTLMLDDGVVSDTDSSLSEFEAADFDDGVYGRGSTRRLYSILGTCLFYKGYMVSSHIFDEDVKDILAFCQSYCLFSVSNVGRILIWREVYPSRKRSPNQNTPFKETSGRYFYLVIGLRQCLLCVLLESGGCSILVEPKPRPPLLYINHATAVILNLEKLGLLKKMDENIVGRQVPAVTQADALVKKSSFFGVSSEKPPSGSNQSSVGSGSVKIPFLSPSKKVTEAAGNDLRPSQTARDSLRVSKVLSEAEDKCTRLTAGAANTLLFFVNFDVFSGALLINRGHAQPVGQMHNAILQNFQRTVSILHDRLTSARRKNPNQNIYEEGSMFLWTKPSKASQKGKVGESLMQYWVVGRCVRSPRLKEFYLCYHDSVRQDTAELTFQLGFGIAG